MALLYFWRGDNYRRDLDMGAGYHLNQSNALLHWIPVGDSLWAFTRNRYGDYVMAAELVISAKTRNPPAFRYGGYRVWGDLEKSRYLAVDPQPLVRAEGRRFGTLVPRAERGANPHRRGSCFASEIHRDPPARAESAAPARD